MPTEMMIRRLRVNSTISDEDAAALRALPSSVKQFAEGAAFFREGDRPTHCCVIMNGFAFRAKITESGKKHVEENKAKIDEILSQLTVYGQRMAYFRDQMEQEEATEAQWGGSPREQQRREWRELKTEFHDIRHELKHVLFSKLSASLDEKKQVLEILRKAIDDIKKL